jgi:putative phosphoribosyl transferase
MFRDRSEAGQALAAKLGRYANSAPIVLALPRGGVPVALEVARVLKAPMDLLFVRKIGVPWQPELAAAAVSDVGGVQLVRNEEVIGLTELPEDYLKAEAEREIAEIARRRKVYCKGRPMIDITGRTVIVVDDGIATGTTVRAALQAVRSGKPAAVVLAVPVAAPGSLAELAPEVDDVECLEISPDFFAIGQFYRSFPPLADELVTAMVNEAEALRSNADRANAAPR